MSEVTHRYRIAVDIGGTFTDFVLVDEATGQIEFDKVLTTPRDPAEAVLVGLHGLVERLRLDKSRIASITHATTLVANSIIERKGAPTALITTRGFRDVLEIGREKRFFPYDLFFRTPLPLALRNRRFEVDERIDARGEVLTPLDVEELRRLTAVVREMGVTSIAVVFLHSYLRRDHEEQARLVIAEEFPDCFVSVSHEVAGEIREYERTSTTVANAYVQPLVSEYSRRLQQQLVEYDVRGPLYYMLSSGGVGRPETARRFPVRLLESGPAAGAVMGSALAQRLDWRNVISFDMGGTTAKTCLIDNFEPTLSRSFEAAREYRFQQGSGIPIQIPVVDLLETGAGGGSIASLSHLGLLQVGPQSAGADPGPICYGQGGTEPTVTDADLVLGYLNPDYFLGGRMRLDVEGARRGLQERIAAPLHLDVVEAAWGISSVANEMMGNSAQVYLGEKGRDPRSYGLIAFGGAGPVHAAAVATKLGIRRLAFPPGEGVASALGILLARPRVDLVRALPSLLHRGNPEAVYRILDEMENEGRSVLRESGVKDADIVCVATADMRYQGQGYAIDVPLSARGEAFAARLQQQFDAEYTRIYGHVIPGAEVEILNYRLCAYGPEPELKLGDAVGSEPSHGLPVEHAVKGTRRAFDPVDRDFASWTVYDRQRLAPGHRFLGPAIIEAPETTVVLPAGARVAVEAGGVITAELAEGES